jgi:hypothetical protein
MLLRKRTFLHTLRCLALDFLFPRGILKDARLYGPIAERSQSSGSAPPEPAGFDGGGCAHPWRERGRRFL